MLRWGRRMSGGFDKEELLVAFKRFLDEHGGDVGILLFEPQRGSFQVDLPWPEELVKTYVSRAQERGILVHLIYIKAGQGRCWDREGG